MKKAQTTNTFTDGLIMDLNPLVTPNTVMSNALNATLITMNGNEYSLQNDMGNGRVETAYLPEGYVPLGTAELGGIIYIVSYNPLIDKCQIGSFPSPERNISSSELPTPLVTVTNSQFQGNSGKLINLILKVKLLSDPDSEDGLFKLSPGDKYTIYSTNNGITSNSDCISDVGNPLHQVDTLPRNVTIHVISIGSDGKIVYLDDSLKWNGNDGKPPHYYIKECDGIDNIATDIDQYRSLVSSAYNVFNSKVSGELALLFELKIIDSFSVTWDANVTNISSGDYNKEADITFYLNYTSQHPDINMKYAIITDSQPTPNLQCSVQTGWNCTIEGLNRQNDGLDPDIPVHVDSFRYNSDDDLSQYIWNYEITPAMSFGYLEHLAIRGSINFQEIGSGKILLDEWRYFIQDNNFYLNWGLSAYPEMNKSIDRVIMTFIPFNKIEGNVILDTTLPPLDTFPQYIISGRTSYSGYFQEFINFGETSRITGGQLLPNQLYLVDICPVYGNDKEWEYRHTLRWLYTTKQWNDKFIEEEIEDFKVLTLDDIPIGFDVSYETKDYTSAYQDILNTNLVVPREFDNNDPYLLMGAQITTINGNYDEEDNTIEFDQEPSCISVDVTTVCTTYPELFMFKKQDVDTYEFSIVGSNITHDDFVPTSDRASILSDFVIPKIDQPDPETNILTIPENYPDIISKVIKNGITDSDEDEQVVDSFTATLTQDKSHFDINFIGAIFSRINAEMEMRTVSIEQEIRPFLYYKDDYTNLGLQNSTKFSSLFVETHRDLGGGDPFAFRFRDERDNSGTRNHESSKSEWNPGDAWDIDNWWQVDPYNDYLNVWMLEGGALFYPIRWDGQNGRKLEWGSSGVKGKISLMARSTDDHYIPINCWVESSEESKLATMVSKIYASLYYVNTEVENKNLAVVECINYMTNYRETWNVVVSSTLNVENIENDIFLIPVEGTLTSNTTGEPISLTELQNMCKAIVDDPEIFDLSNISKGEQSSIKFEDKTLSHTFSIYNYDLFQKYTDAKSTVYEAIMRISSELDWRRCPARVAGKVYVYDHVNDNFIRLASQSATGYIITNAGDLKEQEDPEFPDLTRVILERKGWDNSGMTLFTKIELDDTTLKFDQNNMLSIKKRFLFEADTHGHTYSYLRNNSGLSIDGDLAIN